ncbi:MAG: 50S ribosomal protein L22 [Saprospiraceae bacterium]|jgi:large subunit ribosomal protein L22
MEAVSKLRNIPMSARKMRLVVDIIRGKDVDQALDILKFTKKEAAVWVEKALLSAISNWENKNSGAADADPDSLFVKEIFSDQGSMLKRFRPAPHGRAHRIRKHTNHVTIVVDSRNPVGPVVEDAVEVEEVETSED